MIFKNYMYRGSLMRLVTIVRTMWTLRMGVVGAPLGCSMSGPLRGSEWDTLTRRSSKQSFKDKGISYNGSCVVTSALKW